MDNLNLETIIHNEGFTLYDTETVSENGRNIFRVYITKKEGITLDDCTKITHIISPLIDLNPPIKGQYFLEVSSPGIERRLKKPKHFMASLEEQIKIKLINTDTVIGKLVKADENRFSIEEDGNELTFSYDEIEKARTDIAW